MDRRDKLVKLVRLFSLIAVVGISIPFISSLLPSRGAGSDLPHIYIGDMTKCSYLLEDAGIKGWVGKKWLVIKDYNDNIVLFTLPTDDEKVLLPDTSWYRYAGSCNKFHPEMLYDKMKRNGVITCHDERFRDDNKWRWNYKGKSLTAGVPDLQQQRFKMEGNHLVVGKK